MKEQIIQKQILDYLRLQGFFAWKNNNQGIYDEARNCWRTIETKGIADITAVRNGVVLFCEVKTDIGIQSESQKQFEESLKDHGGIYVLARSLDDIIKWLESLI